MNNQLNPLGSHGTREGLHPNCTAYSGHGRGLKRRRMTPGWLVAVRGADARLRCLGTERTCKSSPSTKKDAIHITRLLSRLFHQRQTIDPQRIPHVADMCAWLDCTEAQNATQVVHVPPLSRGPSAAAYPVPASDTHKCRKLPSCLPELNHESHFLDGKSVKHRRHISPPPPFLTVVVVAQDELRRMEGWTFRV
jgi:hypothetical protein